MKIFIYAFCFLFSFNLFAEYKWEWIDVLDGSTGVDFIEDNLGNYYYANGNAPFISRDKGRTWEHLLAFPTYGFHVNCDSKNRFYCFYDSVYFSDDFGKSFNAYKNFEGITSEKIYLVNSSIFEDTLALLSIYYTSDSVFSAIYYSTDRGISFKRNKLISDKNKDIFKNIVRDKNGNYFYLIYGEGKAEDGIYSMQSITDTNHKLIYKFDVLTYYYNLKIMYDTILVSQYGYMLKYTSDKGKTWFPFKNQPSYFNAIFTNRTSLIAVDGRKCWITNDFGETWEIIHDNVRSETFAIRPLISSDGICFLDFPEDGLLRGELITDVKHDYYEQKDFDYSLSPNPATNYIEINTTTVIPAKAGISANIKIYDVLGVCVLSQGDSRFRGNDRQVSQGNVRIDVSELSPGAYFVRVGAQVLKFVKM